MFSLGDMPVLIGMEHDGHTLSDEETPLSHQMQIIGKSGVSVIVILSLVSAITL